MGPAEIWPVIVGVGTVIYGAGHIVGGMIEKAKNGRFIAIAQCDAYRELDNQRWESVKENMDKMSIWIDKQRN